jgi:hypothetical protein
LQLCSIMNVLSLQKINNFFNNIKMMLTIYSLTPVLIYPWVKRFFSYF